MRFFHLSDLHIGKQLHHYSLKEDQTVILNEIISLAESLRPDAVVIAGDVYDKSVPSAEAVTLFDDFLTRMSAITPAIPILIISGNHDSAERLRYAAGILKKYYIYLAGNVPGNEEEYIQKVTLEDEYGEVDFYLLPFLKPSYVKNVFPGEVIESYTEAVAKLIEREKILFDSKRNVLVSHQFYTGSEKPETCDSEVISVGGIDNVDIEAVKPFDYVALGHLHGRQKVGEPHIRYCGTPLKYSVSEAGHEKCLTMVTLKEKGTAPEIAEIPFHPIRDVRKKKGTLSELLAQAKSEEADDYVSITLTDEVDPYHPKEQLEEVYSHILEVRIDNTRTRRKLSEFAEEVSVKDPFAAFEDFYLEMQGRKLTEEETSLMREIFEQTGEV